MSFQNFSLCIKKKDLSKNAESAKKKEKDYCNEVFQKKKSADGKSYRVQQKLTQ